jgi:hypothetical protein
MPLSFLRRVQAAALIMSAATLVAGAQTLGTPERYSATAVNEPGRGTTPIQIAVDRWSTDKERDALVSTLLDHGADKLLAVLQDTPKVGFIRSSTGGLGWDLHYARKTMLPDGGERVILATDRPLTFWEESRQPRTVDYPFTIIELRIAPNGEGEGKLSLATKIIADKESGTIVLEDYGTQPVLLMAVKKENRTT